MERLSNRRSLTTHVCIMQLKLGKAIDQIDRDRIYRMPAEKLKAKFNELKTECIEKGLITGLKAVR